METVTHEETEPGTEVQSLQQLPVPDSDVPTTEAEPDLPVRQRRPPAYLSDYHCNVLQQTSALVSPSKNATSGTRYPIEHYVSCARFSQTHAGFLAAVTAGDEPSTYKQAVLHSHWRDAMNRELDALKNNNTWRLMPLPLGKKAIGSKWVYRIKYKSDGQIERHKARLVILGNRQIEGVDFTETFAPVACMATVRVFLAVAAIKNWELHQMDVHNAFLHGDLHEEVYMTPPLGLSGVPHGHVCRLQKSLYGLRQAPRNWFSKLATSLRTYGFRQSYADYSLFTYVRGNIELHVLIYVDDLIVAGNDSRTITLFKNYLSSCFHMKDLGSLRYFLGIEIARNETGIFLSQRKYTLDILSETGLLAAKPMHFPMEQQHRLAQSTSPDCNDPERYRRLIGRLIYLTITRPEISYAVHTLSQFMQVPKQDHWNSAMRLLHYLKGSPGKGLLLAATSQLQLHAYCDSDWGACPLTRRSVTGFFVQLGNTPISWKTKKQHTVSRSSAEAEYRSMASVTCELIWLKSLLLSLGIHHQQPMQVFCDSQAALHIAANPVFHERTKHIEIDCHLVRDQIQTRNICTRHIASADQPADLFTKALGKQQFQLLIGKLGMIDPHAPT